MQRSNNPTINGAQIPPADSSRAGTIGSQASGRALASRASQSNLVSLVSRDPGKGIRIQATERRLPRSKLIGDRARAYLGGSGRRYDGRHGRTPAFRDQET